MRTIRFLGSVLLILLVLILAGDYLNLPLWPTDWLKTSFPVEVRLNLENTGPEETQVLLSKSRYSRLELCAPDGTLIRELHLDNQGIARFVVREGRYAFRGMVATLEDSAWISYVQQKSKTGMSPVIRFDQPGKVFILTLEKSEELKTQSKQEILRVYLVDGDLEAARALAAKLSPDTVRDIENLMETGTKIANLPVDAYNSMIQYLQICDRILAGHDIPGDDRVLKLDGEILHVQSRLKAVRTARDKVIESYLQIMEQFQGSGRLIDVLEEWNQMTGNPELYDPEMELESGLADEIRKYEAVAAEVVTMLPSEIRTTYDRSVSLYEAGDLIEARKRFTRLLTFIRNLNMEEDYGETVTAIQEYIEDIEIIAAANHAIRSDNPDRAMMLFSSVARPNKMVFDRMEEIREFQRLRGVKAGSE
ncbi:MAG TPA: hypothetical protein PLV45_00200 [bacterium]|nr:hypothetical protein [bacterium]